MTERYLSYRDRDYVVELDESGVVVRLTRSDGLEVWDRLGPREQDDVVARLEGRKTWGGRRGPVYKHAATS